MNFIELLRYAQRSRQARLSIALILTAIASFAQGDPFSALGQSAQQISTGTFVTGLIELAIVIGGSAF